ncbi:MAG: Crp/Fnr family transcriptional regulator [Pseudomonadota bacterium]
MNAPAKVALKSDCSSCPIRHRAVCANCEPDELRELERMKSYRSVNAGETILYADDDMPFVASIVTGVASLSKTLEDGRRQMVGLLLPSDFIGRPGRSIAPFDVVAATDVLLCQFQRPAFEGLLARSPAIGSRLLEMTLDELDAARDWMVLLGRKTAREKIASLLAIVARRQEKIVGEAQHGHMVFDLHLTRETMADYLGLTIETVSRQITALRKDGVIVLEGNRTVAVPDYARLLDEAGEDGDGAPLS